MKEIIKYFIREWCNRPIVSVLTLAVIGLWMALIFQRRPLANAEIVQRPPAMHRFQRQTAPQIEITNEKETVGGSELEVMAEAQKTADEYVEPQASPDRLNIAYLYWEEGKTDAYDSMAGSGLRLLQQKEMQWFRGLYSSFFSGPGVLGRYNPYDESHDISHPASWKISSWERVSVSFVNGSGAKVAPLSNHKAILAMASVYDYYQPFRNTEELEQYLSQLWDRTHSYNVSRGNIYYCQGCLADGWNAALVETHSPDDQWPEIKNADRASDSEAAAQNDWDYRCPGHADLVITVRITGLEEKKNLFSRDSIGSKKTGFDENWNGWNEEYKQQVKELYAQDWEQEYQLFVSPIITLGLPLSETEIQEYLAMLPADLSSERYEFIKYALASVGKIPYYYGGKPSSEGYEKNNFGTVIGPDRKGRFLKGLDCSGLVNWVYWSVFHKIYPYDGTEGFVSQGTPVKKDQLLPGDIGVLPGKDSHAVIFLAWADENRSSMYAIHAKGGPENSVVVTIVTGNWPYYRRVIE